MRVFTDKNNCIHTILPNEEINSCIVDDEEVGFSKMTYVFMGYEDIEIILIEKKRKFCTACKEKTEQYLFSKKIEQYSPGMLEELAKKIEYQKELKSRWRIVLAKVRPVEGLLSEHFFAYISEEREKDYKVAFSSTDKEKRIGHDRKRVPKKSITDFVEREEDAVRIIEALDSNIKAYKKALLECTERLQKEYEDKAKTIINKIKDEVDFR